MAIRSRNRPDSQRSFTFAEEARRTQIVECAIDTIADVGYGQASLAGIAKRAGISNGAISYHFAGKDQLIERVMEHVYTKGAEEIGPRLEAQLTAAATLRAYITANIAFIRCRSHRYLQHPLDRITPAPCPGDVPETDLFRDVRRMGL